MQCLNPTKIKVNLPFGGFAVIDAPCRRCLNCRINSATEWALRLSIENTYWDKSIFLTLTYDDEHLPSSWSKEDITLFLKRLRKSIYPDKISYYLVGELGERTRRIHYHAIIFGYSPDDSILLHYGKHSLFTSPSLARLWGKGNVSFGSVEDNSISYVTHYLLKDFGDRLNPLSGEIMSPFMRVSTRPAIAARFFQNMSSDTDFCYFRGKKYPLPSFAKKLQKKNILTVFSSEKALSLLKVNYRRRFESVMIYNHALENVVGFVPAYLLKTAELSFKGSTPRAFATF